jgi:hypothetical protein
VVSRTVRKSAIASGASCPNCSALSLASAILSRRSSRSGIRPSATAMASRIRRVTTSVGDMLMSMSSRTAVGEYAETGGDLTEDGDEGDDTGASHDDVGAAMDDAFCEAVRSRAAIDWYRLNLEP